MDTKTKVENEEITIDLYEILLLFRQKIVFILIALVVGAAAAGLVTKFLITPKYTATSKMYIVTSSNSVLNLSDLQLGTNLAPDYRELLTARPLLNTVIEDLKLDCTVQQLRNMLTVANTSGTRILTVTVTHTDPQKAADIANKIAEVAVVWLPEMMNSSAPNIYEDAVVPPSPSSPSLIRNVAIGALLLAVAYCAFEVIRYLLNDTITSADQMEHLFGSMPLTMIPEEKAIAEEMDD
ncbi:MAG: capsular polysaccharide biosynthesis protein [Clostridia bacterium]|nr:capsular polysaccharide biosynthesis protein [Clostridia bacterium]